MAISSIRDVFDLLDGYRGVAALTGESEGTVSSWKSRGFVPDRARPPIVAEAQRKAVEAEQEGDADKARRLRAITYESLTTLAITRPAPADGKAA